MAGPDPRYEIAICCLTRRRPRMLDALLRSFEAMRLPEKATVRFLVVENDDRNGSEEVVSARRYRIGDAALGYRLEPRQGIPVARNTAVRAAIAGGAGVVVFVDDDEVVSRDWLCALHRRLCETGAWLVGGPVRCVPVATHQGPVTTLVAAGVARRYAYLERRSLHRMRTGARERLTVLTNNWMADARIFTQHGIWFDETKRLSGGDDPRFFRDVVAAGLPTAWAPAAIVTEEVPTSRLTARYQLRRAMGQSTTSVREKIARGGGRLPVLPKLLGGIAIELLYATGLVLATPFAPKRTFVPLVRSLGWLGGRVAGLTGRESLIYENPTGD